MRAMRQRRQTRGPNPKLECWEENQETESRKGRRLETIIKKGNN